MKLIARFRCWLSGGHDEYRFCDPVQQTFGYVCARCGRESVVTCDYNEPVVTAHGLVQRHVLFNQRLVTQKKRGAQVWLHGVIERRRA